MPVMDGLEASRQIRKFAEFKFEDTQNKEKLIRTPYIIALTAHAMHSDRERCILAGMDEYLSKPVQMEALRQVLEYAEMKQKGDKPVESVQAEGENEVTETGVIEGRVIERYIEQLGMDNQGALVELIDIFLETTPEYIQDLFDGVQNRDLNTIRNYAHSLKSSSASLGAIELSRKCKILEMRMKNEIEQAQNVPGDGGIEFNGEEYFREVNAIQQEFELVKRDLGEYRKTLISK